LGEIVSKLVKVFKKNDQASVVEFPLKLPGQAAGMLAYTDID